MGFLGSFGIITAVIILFLIPLFFAFPVTSLGGFCHNESGWATKPQAISLACTAYYVVDENKIDQNQSIANRWPLGIYGNHWSAQTFTPNYENLVMIKLKIFKTGFPVQDLTVQIRALDPDTNTPMDGIIAQTSLSKGPSYGGPSGDDVFIPISADLNAGAHYAIVLGGHLNDGSNNLDIFYSDVNGAYPSEMLEENNVSPTGTITLAWTRYPGFNFYFSTIYSHTNTSILDCNSTQYRLDLGGWKDYLSPILISADGNHRLDYYSTDLLSDNNAEPVKTAYISIDSTPPMTSVFPSSGWIGRDTNFFLLCDDNYSECHSTTYKIDDGNFFTYFGPFLIKADTNHRIDFNSADNAGNIEPSKTFSIKIDQNSPVISSFNASVSGQSVTFNLTASDGNGSGVKGFYASVDGNNWIYTNGTSLTLNNLSNGAYAYFAHASDFADNNSTDTNVSFTINFIPPCSNCGGGGGGVSHTSSYGGTSASITPKTNDLNKTPLADQNKSILPIVTKKTTEINADNNSNIPGQPINQNASTSKNNSITSPPTGFFGLNSIQIGETGIIIWVVLFAASVILFVTKRRPVLNP